ncbi:MAG: Uma2 family endonuclease [Eubacteriales bacterium]|nr:Uma2 family endonuclease [Eubacteriales bacterium]
MTDYTETTTGNGAVEGKEGALEEASAAEQYAQNADRANRTQKDAGGFGTARDPRIPVGGGYTEKDYFALPEDLRVELIDGVFYDMASPAKLHQKAAFEIARQLEDCIEENRKECFLYIAPSDVALGDDGKTVVQPDIYVHCDREKDRKPGPHRGAPDFIVEILSPYNPENDLWRKRELYQRYGVREYWIVNPQNGKIYVFIFPEDSKAEIRPKEYSFDGLVPVQTANGTCRVDFRKVYRKIEHLL